MGAIGVAIGFIVGLCTAFTIYICVQVCKEYKRVRSVRRNAFTAQQAPPDDLNRSRTYKKTVDLAAGKSHTTQIHYQNHGPMTFFFGTCSCGWMTKTRCPDADEVSKAIDNHFLAIRIDEAAKNGSRLGIN